MPAAKKTPKAPARRPAAKTPARPVAKQVAKVVAKAAARPAPAPAPVPKKPKLVRDSFTMPKADFDLIDVLKGRAMGFGRHVKKSELLRAGLQALVKLDDAALQAVLAALPQLKPGRPGKAA